MRGWASSMLEEVGYGVAQQRPQPDDAPPSTRRARTRTCGPSFGDVHVADLAGEPGRPHAGGGRPR